MNDQFLKAYQNGQIEVANPNSKSADNDKNNIVKSQNLSKVEKWTLDLCNCLLFSFETLCAVRVSNKTTMRRAGKTPFYGNNDTLLSTLSTRTTLSTPSTLCSLFSLLPTLSTLYSVYSLYSLPSTLYSRLSTLYALMELGLWTWSLDLQPRFFHFDSLQKQIIHRLQTALISMFLKRSWGEYTKALKFQNPRPKTQTRSPKSQLH